MDFLDDIHTQVSKCKLEARSQTMPTSSFDKETESRMKQVLHNLGYLVAIKNVILGLMEASGSGVRSCHKNCQHHLWWVKIVVYGRDDDKNCWVRFT
ncbi:hypothetical protein CR513_11178, partial [Mucuna pruriens]